MKPRLIVLFGKPGVGKTFVGKILRETHDYFLYNADRSLPKIMREALFTRKNISDTMRDAFMKNIVRHTKKLSKKHSHLAIIQTFLKETMRQAFKQQFPHSQFLFLETDDEIREKRYLGRTYFNLGLKYLRTMSRLFEPPKIPHTVIDNNEEGSDSLTKQLTQIFHP